MVWDVQWDIQKRWDLLNHFFFLREDLHLYMFGEVDTAPKSTHENKLHTMQHLFTQGGQSYAQW